MNRRRQTKNYRFRRNNGFLYSNSIIFPAALAFCGCYIDVISLMGLYDTFTAAITGSLIYFFIDLERNPSAAPIKLIVVLAFAMATFIWHSCIANLRTRGKKLLKNMLSIEAILLLTFLLIAVNFNLSSPLKPATIACVIFSASAMSLQHLVTTSILPHKLPTTMITGITVRLMGGIHELLESSTERPNTTEKRGKNTVSVIVLGFFLAGGGIGIISWRYFSFHSLLLPVLIIFVLAFSSKD